MAGADRRSGGVWLRLLAALAGMLVGASAHGGAEHRLGELLARAEPPPGVVFEIAGGDPDALREHLPRVQDYVQRLRARFPDLEVAVVTHGSEQFALQRSERRRYEQVHRQVQSLADDQQVPVHICETFAGWRGVTAEDFPDYVQVAPSGPAHVNAYRDLGYVVVDVP